VGWGFIEELVMAFIPHPHQNVVNGLITLNGWSNSWVRRW
jgi:hypothetical protein